METKQEFVNKGLQHFAEKNYERAIFFFRKALECDAKFETAYRTLCESLNRLDEIDEAYKFAKKWLEINNKNPLAYLTLSKIYTQKGHKDEARSALLKYQKLMAEQKTA